MSAIEASAEASRQSSCESLEERDVFAIRDVNIGWQARMLQVLRWSEWILVIGLGKVGLVFVGQSIMDFAHGDWVSAVFCVTIGPALIYMAFSCMQHIARLDPVGWRSLASRLNIAFVVVLIWMLVLWIVESNSHEDSDLAPNIIIGVVVTTVFALSRVSLFLLRRTRLKSLNKKLDTVLRNIEEQGGDRGAMLSRGVAIHPRRGWIFAVVGVAILVAGGTLDASVLSAHPEKEPPSGLFNWIAVLMLLRARSHLQISADSLLAVDRRRPILFLRSFEDDSRIRIFSSLKNLFDLSLETRLSSHFSRFGPFVAIGSPKESVPQIGAARVMLPDDQWQEQVLSWMAQAQVIVMYAGLTPWVQWELNQIVDSGEAHRLILLMPEVRRKLFRRRQPRVLERLQRAQLAFAGTRWEAELTAATSRNLRQLRAVAFLDDGSLLYFYARSFARDSYHLAAVLAHGAIMGEFSSLTQPINQSTNQPSD